MAVIEIDERVAAAIRAQADLRDMSVQAFLKRMVEAATPVNPTPTLAEAEIEMSLDELCTESPVLPENFSRIEIYDDHD